MDSGLLGCTYLNTGKICLNSSYSGSIYNPFRCIPYIEFVDFVVVVVVVVHYIT
jgi:hypothetical protein